MSRQVLIWIGALLLCQFAGTRVAADSTAATATDSSRVQTLTEIISSLEPNSLIRLERSSGKFVEGELRGHDERQITVLIDALDVSTVATDDVNSLWLPGGNKRRLGATIGGITGAVLGGLFFVGLVASYGGGDFDEVYVGYFFLGGACGWPIGAIIGGILGTDVIEWDKRYP